MTEKKIDDGGKRRFRLTENRPDLGWKKGTILVEAPEGGCLIPEDRPRSKMCLMLHGFKHLICWKEIKQGDPL